MPPNGWRDYFLYWAAIDPKAKNDNDDDFVWVFGLQIGVNWGNFFQWGNLVCPEGKNR